MIGNDIVDLNLAKIQSNWQRKGFLMKVFTNSEQELIRGASEPDQLVWRLWSMKESVYKATLKNYKKIRLNPVRFECRLLDEKNGEVRFNGFHCFTISEMNEDYVHSVAYQESAPFKLHYKVTGEQPLCGKELYQSVISYLTECFNWVPEGIFLQKNSLGIPEFYRFGKKIPVFCSLSHHGRYESYLIAASNESIS